MAVVEVKFVGIDAVTEVMTGGLRRIGEAAVNLLGSALSGLGNFAAESFQGALEAQKGIDALSNAISNLGEKSPVTMAGAEALADQFKNLVGGSDDAVLAMVEMATRFDQISGDTIPQFIQQSADLAAKLGLDPVKAAQILGKTLQDMSVDGVGAMGKLKTALGIELPEAQEKAILAMVEAGDVAGAQAVLFDVLGQRTAGAAQIAADSAAGQWAIFQETIADAGEGVALALLPALTQLASDVLPKLVPIIEDVAGALSGFLQFFLEGDIAAAFDNLGEYETFQEIFKALGISIYEVGPAVEDFAAKVQEFLVNQVVPAFQQAVAWIQENWPAIQAAIADGWAQAQPVLQAIGDFIVNVVIPAFNQAVQWVITNWPMIQATIATVMAQIQAVIATVLDAVNAFWTEWGDEIMAFTAGVFEYFSNIFSAFSKAFSGDWRGFGEDLKKAWDLLWEAIKEIAGNAVEWFNTVDWGAVGEAIMQGIADGISAGAQWIMDAAQAAAQAAVDAVKGFLGIESPSKVFAGIGQNMMAGMSEGIMGGMGAPTAAAQRVSNQIANTVNSGGNTINYYGVQADMQYAYNRAVAGAF